MAEKDGQIRDLGPKRRPDILRAKDIIPFRPGPEDLSESQEATQQEIPQFSLADDIMAEQRRLSGLRRKSPSSVDSRPQTPQRPAPIEHKEPLKDSVSLNIHFDSQSYTSRWDPVIAEIVTRDIERFCFAV